MSAMDTALRVLTWSTADQAGIPPRGRLAELTRLAEPSVDLRDAVARLAAVSCARMMLTVPPFDDARPPGVSSVLLAAAIGGRQQPSRAERLAQAIPLPGNAYDLLAHFRLATCAGPHLSGRLHDAVLRTSPLSGLFGVPPEESEIDVEAVLETIVATADGRRLVTMRLAEVPANPAQARWRGGLLARMRHTDREFVLNVYEAAMQYHGAGHRQRIADCERYGGEIRTATARWWAPLAQLERANAAMLRSRTQLIGYMSGISLYWRSWSEAARG